MDDQQNFQIFCESITLILQETARSKYLPEWLYNYWHPQANTVFKLKDTIHQIENDDEISQDLVQKKNQIINLLDQERYFARVHLNDDKLLGLIQDALVVALFFNQEDVHQYIELVQQQNSPEKFLTYLNTKKDITAYKEYLKKQQAVFGRFIQNFSDEEITLAAKTQMINGKLLEILSLEEFLKKGFQYVIKELKVLNMNKIEKGFLNQERINSYTSKISLLLHPANELHLNPVELIKNARYVLEDIINAAGIEASVPIHPEHQAIIRGCYWIDEMFKSAAAREEITNSVV